MNFEDLKDKSIPEMESEILRFWKENKVFEKSVEQRPESSRYVFYDGPPFISGLPHYGHLLGSIAKDIVPRYFTMQGKRVERVWGWDAHGLTVENKVQKKLGIKDRKDIETFGLEKFTNACYDYTSQVSQEWNWYIDKIGRWVDMDNAYKTIDQNYMESAMWVFSELYKKGFIYEGVRTSLYCTTCGTPVSNFEIAMDNTYKEVVDPAVTVKFRISSKGKFEGVFMLAWTTTPWTLPSNRALVVDPEEDYAIFEKEDDKYIVAEKRLEYITEGKTSPQKVFKGKDLVGLSYEPPYKFYSFNDKDFKVYSYEGMVTMEEGTGIVHSAPGFGEIDTKMGVHYDLSMTLAINNEGVFVPDEQGENPFAGIFYKDADPQIIDDLIEKECMFKNEKVLHRFPYHDRCDTLLIQKAQNSWFINIAAIRKRMISLNEDINWVPDHLKEGRFRQGIEQAPDWCISRTRFWATPMPVWEAEDGDRIVVSSKKELEELSGQKVENLHRPFIDEIVINKNGKKYKRRSEVLDSWFEAGSMPYAQMHYPFENTKKFEDNFPGDYVVEYIAQVRAWFYVMHVLSTALFDSNSFKNVISTGVMAGSDGRKMSKTYQNYTDPKKVLEEIGGDALRLYLMNSPLMVGGNANFDEVELKTKVRNVLNPLWNSLKFFKIYEQMYSWTSHSMVSSKNVLDIWIKTRLHETIKAFSENMENYTIPPAMQALEEFVDDLSRWYVRRSRERISAGDNEALSTLYYVLLTFAKASAPAIPFIAEAVYKSLSDTKDSVHLCDYPSYDKDLVENNREFIENMKVTRDIVSAALSLRIEKGIKVRQPLATLITNRQGYYEDLVREEVNVKEILFDEKQGELVVLDMEITPQLKAEGAARELIRKIQDLRKKHGMSVEDRIEATYEDNEENRNALDQYGDMVKQKVMAEALKPGDSYEIRKI